MLFIFLFCVAIWSKICFLKCLCFVLFCFVVVGGVDIIQFNNDKKKLASFLYVPVFVVMFDVMLL